MPTEPPLETGPSRPDALGLEEFRALRATVRERGSVRVVVSLITFVSWAGLAVLLAHAGAGELLWLVPLLVLAVGFELIAGLHVGVERIGRYVRVFYETAGTMPKWESAIALFGQTPSAGQPTVRPLLTREFGMATLLNALLAVRPSLLLGQRPTSPETAFLLLAHLAYAGRLVQVGRRAARQRDLDEAAFRTIAGKLGEGAF